MLYLSPSDLHLNILPYFEYNSELAEVIEDYEEIAHHAVAGEEVDRIVKKKS